jgi:hypothetical protein
MGAITRRKQLAGLVLAVALFIITTAGPAQAEPPLISSFSPTSGPVGTSVTINGSHFSGATSVAFNGTNATFTVNSGTKITAIVPSNATSGKISVTKPTGIATSSTDFTVTPQGTPTISGFNPSSGPVGTSVTINGSNFTGASSVAFHGTSATFTVNSASKITATVPANATTGTISVTTPIATATSSGTFTVTTGPAPIITGINPNSGPVGSSVTINGSNFTGTTLVEFNGTSATFTVNSDSKITATVPANATTGKIKVTTPGGSDTSTTFTVTGGPAISGFNPNSGAVGTSVTINGSGFTGATLVQFNGTSATFTVNSDSKITAVVPANATTGKIKVTTPGGSDTSGATFTVIGAPAISSFSPTSGPVGTSVTINGANLNGATVVQFSGTSSTFTVNSGSKITATVPSNAATGKISVTTPGGTATSSNSFTVTPNKHARAVSLQLSGHLVATGLVSVTDGFSACEQSVPVKIQRRSSGRWHTVGGTLTRMDGSYRIRVADRGGKYRARAKRTELVSGDICGRATSGIRRN